MPTYDYRCQSCSHIREVKHKINEEPHVLCDNCGKEMTKMVSAPGVKFVGNWFKNKGKY